MDTRRLISERKLQANRANAKQSTGPKTEAGKATSRRNALKHGILSCSVDLSVATPGLDVRSKLNGSLPGTDPALQEINRIWGKLARIVAFEKDCTQRPAGLERNARLICRYERMLTRQLHARIRECAALEKTNLKTVRESL